MSKKQIQQEREKRQGMLAQIRQEKAQLQAQLSEVNVIELKLIGAIEQLDILEPPCENGVPVGKKAKVQHGR